MDGDASFGEEALRLGPVLGCTLDVERLLDLLHAELAALVPCRGLGYRHTEEELALQIGRPGRHRLSYRLSLADRTLGELVLSRSQPFTPEEIDRLEMAMCAVLHPLRNCLLYRRAMLTALQDAVTGIPNRRALELQLQREVELAHRHQGALSLLVVDCDHFKRINDRHGHQLGDAVLRGLAGRLTACMRRSDAVFRFGGEEFVALLSRTELHGARRLAERLRGRVANEVFCLSERQVPLTVSVGIASLGASDDAESLLGRADEALYAAKLAGRNCVAEAPPSGSP